MVRWIKVDLLFWIVALVAGGLLFFGIFSSPTGMKGYLNKKSQLMLLNQNIETLENENDHLYKHIKQFKSDPKCRMKIIREQLGWIRDGERKVVLVPQR